MYKCKYFKIRELVHPDLLKTIPEDILWMMFDDRLLRAADLIREEYGPIFVNGYGLTDCGLRDINSLAGAKYSAHKIGRALDLHIKSIEDKNLSTQDKINAYNNVRFNIEHGEFEKEEALYILLTQDNISCLNFEDNVSWLHIDTYNRPNRLFKA